MNSAEANRVIHNTSIHKMCNPLWVATWTLLVLFQIVLRAPAARGQVGSSAASLRVRVTDSLAETPIERARVELMKFPDGVMQQGFSDSSGSLEFSGLAAQTYVLRATKHGYLDAELQVDVRRGEFARSVGLSMQRTQAERNEPAQGSVAARNLSIPDAALREFQLGAKFLNTEKNLSKSIVHFQRAIELYPDYSDAYFLLGTAQMQLNDAKAAETSLRKAIALDAHRTGPYYPLSMLLFGQRRFNDEEELLLSAQKQDAADWRWPFELARCHAQQSRWDRALQYGLAATGIANAPSKVHLLLADIYANSDKPREAVAELELFAQLDPQSAYMARVREVLPALRQRAAAAPQQPR